MQMQGHGMPLSPDLQIQVLHIVQEALSNVRKHAKATRVWLDIQQQPQWRFEVRDDGVGFVDPRETGDETHVGLRIMAERAERIGADARRAVHAGTRHVRRADAAAARAGAARRGRGPARRRRRCTEHRCRSCPPRRFASWSSTTTRCSGAASPRCWRATTALQVVGDAADAGEALRRARELQPDLILLDNHLPGVNGVDALPAIARGGPGRRAS